MLNLKNADVYFKNNDLKMYYIKLFWSLFWHLLCFLGFPNNFIWVISMLFNIPFDFLVFKIIGTNYLRLKVYLSKIYFAFLFYKYLIILKNTSQLNKTDLCKLYNLVKIKFTLKTSFLNQLITQTIRHNFVIETSKKTSF